MYDSFSEGPIFVGRTLLAVGAMVVLSVLLHIF